MPTEVLMPALSPTMEEGTLSQWLVKEGDEVKSGDVIAEIETDKATMEVEAVDEGRLGKILVPAGSEGVKVNAPIALLLEEGEDEGDLSDYALEGGPGATGSASADAPSPPPKAGEGDKGVAQSPAPASEAPRAPAANGSGQGRIKASPLTKRLAKEAGLDLTALSGSGPHGRIVMRDVEAAQASGAGARPAPEASQPAAEKAPAPASPQAPPAGKITVESLRLAEGSYEVLPLDGMRKTIAKRMTESFQSAPHFPLNVDFEIDRLLKLRKALNEKAPEGVKISVNDMIIRACALALKAVPESNASYTDEGLILHHHAHVAVAVAIEGGLITPVVFNAETKGLARIAAEMKDLAARARERKLKPEEYQGGTFSISNLGMFGIQSFGSILNAPQGMILSVGAGEKRPVVKDDALAMATVMSLTLTCDHRVVDGATGARFLQALKPLIEDPVTMLL